MSNELEAYVREERNRGVTDSDIHKELLLKGWEPNKVVEALKVAVAPAPLQSKDGRKYSNLGILFACLTLITLPIVFGPIGIIFGIKGYLRGDEKRGIFAIVASVVLALVSTFLAMLLMNSK